jgi:hypothetical protein
LSRARKAEKWQQHPEVEKEDKTWACPAQNAYWEWVLDMGWVEQHGNLKETGMQTGIRSQSAEY